MIFQLTFPTVAQSAEADMHACSSGREGSRHSAFRPRPLQSASQIRKIVGLSLEDLIDLNPPLSIEVPDEDSETRLHGLAKWEITQ